MSGATSIMAERQRSAYQGVIYNYGTLELPSTTSPVVDVTINCVALPLTNTVPQAESLSFTVPYAVGGITIRTEFDAGPSATYASERNVTPTFTIANMTAVGPQVMLSLVSATSSSITPVYTSNNDTTSTTDSIPSTKTSATTATETSSTASNTTGSSNGTTVHSKASTTYSTGELVGAAVGCLIAGLLIASLLAFFFLKRRKNSGRSRYTSQREMYSGDDKGESVKLATSPVASWQRHLPQPESDQTISRLVNRTLDDIELYVENYYADRPTTQMTGSAATDMSPLSSPYLGRPLSDIIHTSAAPTVLFKHCMAYYLLQKIDPAQNDSSSLLPREFVVPSRGDRKALSQVRVLMAHSQSDIDEDENYLMQRDRAAQTIVQQIERAFLPWARGTTQDRAKNLKGILTHLSEVGNKLFSQPANFEWRWNERRTPSQGQLVMLPGLDKTTDTQAVPLATPICIVEPRLGRFVQ